MHVVVGAGRRAAPRRDRHQPAVRDDRDDVATSPAAIERRPGSRAFSSSIATSSPYEPSQSPLATAADGVDHGSRSTGNAIELQADRREHEPLAADRACRRARSAVRRAACRGRALGGRRRERPFDVPPTGERLAGTAAGRGSRVGPRRSAGRTAGRSRPGAPASPPRPRRRRGTSGRTSARRTRRRRGSVASRRGSRRRRGRAGSRCRPSARGGGARTCRRARARARARARSRSPSDARRAPARRPSAGPALLRMCSGTAILPMSCSSAARWTCSSSSPSTPSRRPARRASARDGLRVVAVEAAASGRARAE